MYRSMGLIMMCCGMHDIYEVLFYLVKEGELVRITFVVFQVFPSPVY